MARSDQQSRTELQASDIGLPQDVPALGVRGNRGTRAAPGVGGTSFLDLGR